MYNRRHIVPVHKNIYSFFQSVTWHPQSQTDAPEMSKSSYPCLNHPKTLLPETADCGFQIHCRRIT